MSTPVLNGPRLVPAQGSASHLVVLLHGYGADGNDLIELGNAWRTLLPGAAFVSPHAPERCATASAGYQWFPINRIDPRETARAVAQVAPVLESFLEAELTSHKLPPERLMLVGFSQGTMMALHVGLRRKVAPAAIVGFSGMLAAPESVAPCASGRPPVLLLHGAADELIPEQALFFSAGALGALAYPVQWHRVPGLGHGIEESGLVLAGAFLALAVKGQLAPLCVPASEPAMR